MSSEEHSAAWTDLACGSLGEGEGEMQLHFDPQAFFSDYVFAASGAHQSNSTLEDKAARRNPGLEVSTLVTEFLKGFRTRPHKLELSRSSNAWSIRRFHKKPRGRP
ncbi:MAG: hypothetical protein LQ337_002095 [Flavoplaca oasis]|nr:MAG: hypothetical protein LQ337_002095 [Flavoplaca oasis]